MAHLARGGTQTEAAVSSLATLLGTHHDADLIITDFSVNDAFEIDGNIGHKSVISGGNVYNKATAISEALVRGIRLLAPGALHLMVFSHCPRCDSESIHGMRVLAVRTKTIFIDKVGQSRNF